MMTVEKLDSLSNELSAEAHARKVNADTLEQWNAVKLLEDASRYVWSAAAWLRQHDLKYGEQVPS